MSREDLIQKTVEVLAKLPADKVVEIANFAEYVFKKHDDDILQKGIEKLVSDSAAFEFLKDEEDLYTINDLKERFK
jgi:hypothetical protein